MTRAVLITLAVAALATVPPVDRATNDPFHFLAPDLALDGEERGVLDAGAAVVRVLPGRDGYLSLSAIVKVNATAERIVAWSRDVEKLQKGRYVPEVGRFSPTPTIDDLRGLTLVPEDLEELRRCRPGDCGVKLSEAEIGTLRAIADPASLDRAFREMLVRRAAGYLARGDARAPYSDHKVPVEPAPAFAALIDRMPFFGRRFGCYHTYLRGFPDAPPGPVQDSFLYWSKESLGLKPIISITHFSVAWFGAPELPEAIVVAKQVYATHYRNASLTMTAIASGAGGRYLVYINRSEIDAFRGLLGGFVRRVVERRVKAEAPDVLRELRRRIEQAEPANHGNGGPMPRR